MRSVHDREHEKAEDGESGEEQLKHVRLQIDPREEEELISLQS